MAHYGRDGLRDRQNLFGSNSPSASGDGSGDIQLTVAPSFDLDTEVDGLRGKIGRMKGLALDIQHESRLNSEILNSLEDTVNKARSNLKRTMKRIDRAFKFTGSGHILMLLVFAMGVLTLFYIWTK
ncbi:t-SNARE coiled-coil homology domain-containing protein [Chloropicon primus]|nr:t-SNARE coiled-coil homology domain-containing protein [Chloropicon primus]